MFFRSGINNSSTNPAPYAGPAGNIDVTALHISISDRGAIDTSAVNAGGGNITINAREMIYLSNKGSITTSVQSGIEDGGNITIEKPQFTLLNNGAIMAQADAGRGGNIRIVAEHFIASADSIVNASSRLGIDGKIILDSPSENISSSLVVIPTRFITTQLQPACGEQRETGDRTSHFTVKHHNSRTTLTHDLQSSPPINW